MLPSQACNCHTSKPIDQITQLNLEIAREGLRQAQESFNLSKQSFKLVFIMTATSGLISLGGVGLLLTERVSEGTATTAGGIASGLCFSQMAKDAKDRLDAANLRLDTIRAEVAVIRINHRIEQANTASTDVIERAAQCALEEINCSDLH